VTCQWVISHEFRKTTGTLLADAGLSASRDCEPAKARPE
jgi:hypothetical protein